MNTETVIDKTSLIEASAVELGQGSLKATALASFVPIEAHLTTLAARYDKVAFNDLATPKGLAAAKAIRLELREQGRFAVQRLQKRLKDEANDLKRIVDDRSEELIAIIRPVEDNAHSQIESEETRRAEAKAERERLEFEERARLAAIEAERVAGLQAGIAKIRGYVARCQEPGMTGERIAAGMAHLEAQVLGAEWGDHLQQAQDAQAESLAAMRSLHASALAREAETARLEAQRIENERVAAEQAEQRRALDAQAAEFRANMARINGHQRRIDEIKAAATGHEDAPAVDLAEAITAVAALDVSEGQYQELAPLAAAAQASTLAVLWRLHDAAAERERLADEAGLQDQRLVEAGPVLSDKEVADANARAFIDSLPPELPAAELRAVAQQALGPSVIGMTGDVSYTPVADVIEPAGDFAPPDFDGDAPLDPAALVVEMQAELAQCRAALTTATDMIDELICAHSPKRMAAGYFARVAALRDMGGLPRPTTTTPKENN